MEMLQFTNSAPEEAQGHMQVLTQLKREVMKYEQNLRKILPAIHQGSGSLE